MIHTEIILYKTDSRNNVLAKGLTNELKLNGTLRENTVITAPVITVEISGAFDYNYAYIADFGRYYFISKIEIQRDKLFRLELRVDVLMSNSTSILGSNATVLYSQNYSNNSNIPDSEYVYENKEDFENYIFYTGLTTNDYMFDMTNYDVLGATDYGSLVTVTVGAAQ